MIKIQLIFFNGDVIARFGSGVWNLRRALEIDHLADPRRPDVIH